MKIPRIFTDKVSSLFYDKDVLVYSVESVVESDGWTKLDLVSSGYTIKGNVNFSNLEQVQKEYGLSEVVDVTITTAKEESIGLNNIISINDITYIVVKAISFDSHKLIIAKQWDSKSMGLPSA